MGSEQRIGHDVTKPQGVASRAADLSRARTVLGWDPSVPCHEGFESTIECFEKTHDRSIIDS